MAHSETLKPPMPEDEPASPEPMAEELKPPIAEYIQALKTQLAADYGEQDQQIDDLREVRELRRKVAISGIEHRFSDIEVRDPTVTDEIQRVSATLSLNRPKLTVTPGRPGDSAEEASTKREHWTEETLWAAGARIPGKHTFIAAVDAAAGDGGGWTKLLFLNDCWEQRYAMTSDDFEDDPTTYERDASGKKRRKKGKSRYQKFDEATEDAKRAAGPPFAWIHVDTRMVNPVWSRGVLTEMLEVQKRPLLSTLRQYRLGLDRKGKIVPEAVGLPMNQVIRGNTSKTVEFLEYWDDTWCVYVVCGEGSAYEVKRFRHGYGRVPYFYAPGFVMNWWANRKVGWGVAQSKRWLVEYLSFLLTLHADMAARDTYAPFYRETAPDTPPIVDNKTGQPLPMERYQLGQIVNGPPGSRLSSFPFPTTSQAIKEQIALVKDQIDRLLTPRVASQIGGGLEGAGFAMNQVLSESRIYHDPIAQNLEAMLVEVTKFLWHLVRTKVREVVWVERTGKDAGWLALGPDDLSEGVGVRWELDPERPSAKLIEERYWHERIDKGTASLKQATEAMGDNYDEVRFERDLEALRQEDWYKKYRRAYLLKEVGRGDLITDAADEAAATGQIPGLPGQQVQAMGNPQVPDMGALAAAPNGAGMGAPVPQLPGGTRAGVVPTQSGAPGVSFGG